MQTKNVYNVRFNLDAETPEEVYHYFVNRSCQLRGDNIAIVPNSFLVHEFGCSVEYRDLVSQETYDSLYVFPSKRGQGFYNKWAARKSRKTIITSPECGLAGYLENRQIPHRVAGLWTDWPEYREVASYYGNQKAKRSGFFYMNHIDEGFAILRKFGAKDYVLKAWLLHPLFQVDLEDFHKRNYGNLQLDMSTVMMGLAYRELANSYLPKNYRTGAPVVEVVELRQMLLADKIQNDKDRRRNTSIEPWRKEELDIYFGKWMLALDRNDTWWSSMTTFISIE